MKKPMAGSLWDLADLTPQYPFLHNDQRCDVAVVGGGLTGITLAALLAEAGVDTVLLEANTLGSGTTGRSTAKITIQHGLIYQKLTKAVGLDGALAYARANQAGFDHIAERVRSLSIDCDYESSSAMVYAEAEADIPAIEKELHILDQLGLKAGFREKADIPIRAAVCMEGQAYFHPMKYLYALAAQAQSAGCRIFERSRVLSVERGPQNCILRTGERLLRARRVVFATNYPLLDMPGFYFARLHQERSYLLCAETPGLPLSSMYITVKPPIHSFRPHRSADGRTLVLVGGYGHKTGRQDKLA